MKSIPQKIATAEIAKNQHRWQRMAEDSSQVIGLRLTLMPWLWMFDQEEAQKELATMISEKQDATNEVMMAGALLPWTFWFEFFAKGPILSVQEGASRASSIVYNTLTGPTRGRVSSNLRRLAG